MIQLTKWQRVKLFFKRPIYTCDIAKQDGDYSVFQKWKTVDGKMVLIKEWVTTHTLIERRNDK